jgi:hypothetical protein
MSRASTFLLASRAKGVNGRDKPGHDGEKLFCACVISAWGVGRRALRAWYVASEITAEDEELAEERSGLFVKGGN